MAQVEGGSVDRYSVPPLHCQPLPAMFSAARVLGRSWLFLLMVPDALAALCSNWSVDTCSTQNDGGCSCDWDNNQCVKTDRCGGMGITGITNVETTTTTMPGDTMTNGMSTTLSGSGMTTPQAAAQVSDAGRSATMAWCGIFPLLATLPLLTSSWGMVFPFA
uniref:PSI domain-containing protein n=1 Tax=Alexandrium catenella TaxID=2925 RepID=A0A7S1WN89_ALECA